MNIEQWQRNIPPISHPRWRQLVIGSLQVDISCLSTKLLLTRIMARASFDPSTVEAGADELRMMFVKNGRAPKMQEDLTKIFSGAAVQPLVSDCRTISKMVSDGRTFVLAGKESALKNVSKGNWIGGTSPYFISDQNPSLQEGQILATELPSVILDCAIKVYDENSLKNIFLDAPENGFSLIVIPAGSKIHFSFALDARNYPGFATRPLGGWIAGVNLEHSNVETPKVFDGRTGAMLENAAIVLHARIPVDKYAEIGVVNIFEQSDGDVITFNEDGFSHTEANINGRKLPLANYIRSRNHNLRLPLVADYHGAMVNSSFQSLDEQTGIVKFYAPVFKGIKYRIAKPVESFPEQFSKRVAEIQSQKELLVFLCNCVLNRAFPSGDQHPFETNLGPPTFGEVAYQLLNQTLIYVTINDCPKVDL